MQFNERLIEILSRKKRLEKISAAKIARLIGVHPTQLQDWKNGRSSPNPEKMKLLAEALGVSLSELISGLPEKIPVDLTVKIPIYEAEASAGHGCLNDTEAVENYLMIDRETIRGELQCNPDHLAIIRVRGDSMTPTIKPGEMVVIDKTVNTFVTDGIYVLRIDETIVVKRVQILLGKRINIISSNQAYPPFQINLSDSEGLTVIGRVMAIISMEKVGA
ncbi:MAG: XRE family transcriptional regulator [Candidatus Riflebacteria bacterium]